MRTDYTLSQLDVLEAESIHVIREVAAEFERPTLLFSGGKDSIVMLALAEKAFKPAHIPFPVMHVDTGHYFPEVIEYRDKRVAELGVRLVVASVQDSIDAGRAVEETGRWVSRNRLHTVTLLDALRANRSAAASGGANTSGCSRCRTGPSSTSGPTSSGRTWRSRRSTTRTSARCSSGTA